MSEASVPPRFLWTLFSLNLAARLASALTLPLLYKEAYHWEWSFFLSPGYLDHPPLVAWLIRSATELFGSQEVWAIRFFPVVMGTVSLLLVRRIAFQLFRDRAIADRALLVALALPVMSFAGLGAFPDAPLLFFHLAFLSTLLWAMEDGGWVPWILAGTLLGFALLAKLMALLTVVAFLLVVLVTDNGRRWCRELRAWACLSVAALLFLPYLLWNADHEWIGLKTQLWVRHAGRIEIDPGKPIEFALEQVGAALVLAVPLWWGSLRRRTGPHSILACFTLPTFGAFFIAGSLSESHPHWAILGYPTAAITLASALSARWQRVASTQAMFVIVLLSLCASAVPLFTHLRGDPGGSFLRREIAEGQRQLTQWATLNESVGAELVARGGGRVFTHGYKRSGPLAYEWRVPHVVNLRSHLRASPRIGDGQSLYVPLEELAGESGIYVTDVKWISVAHLELIFSAVKELDSIEIGYTDDSDEVLTYRMFQVDGLWVDGIRAIQEQGAWRVR